MLHARSSQTFSAQGLPECPLMLKLCASHVVCHYKIIVPILSFEYDNIEKRHSREKDVACRLGRRVLQEAGVVILPPAVSLSLSLSLSLFPLI